jgi:hypothetical protein
MIEQDKTNKARLIEFAIAIALVFGVYAWKLIVH